MGRFNRGGHRFFKVDRKLLKQKRDFKAARLIVRNLSFKSTEENVKEHFSQYGNISEVKLLRKGDKLVGCGFIQYESKDDAATAIKNASGNKFLGRVVIADWAIPKDRFMGNLKQDIKEDNDIKEETDSIKEEVLSDSENEDQNGTNDSDSEDSQSEKEDEDDDSPDHSIKEETSDEEMDNDVNDDEEDEDDDDEEEYDDSDEDKKGKVKKIKSNDVVEGRTVFIKNVPFLATEDELEKVVKKFGPIFYAKICMDPMTEHSKGTAFVKFKTKPSADACLSAGTEFTLNGTVLDPHPAVSRAEIHKKHNQPKAPSDSRNLYLLKEGVVMAGSKAAEEVSASDMAKRLQIERWKKQIIKDLCKFVSRNRIVIHNLPDYYDDKRVAAMLRKYGPSNAQFGEVKVMRDLNNLDNKGVGKSKGFAFVSFTTHEDALKTLRSVNNNPSIFKPQRRPIVSFSIESHKALNVKKMRLEKSRQPKPKENSEKTIKIEDDDQKLKKRKRKRNGKDTDESKNKVKKLNHNEESKNNFKNSKTDNDGDKEQFSGSFATPGSKKFLNDVSFKRQALLHRKQVKLDKAKTKSKSKKMPRPLRKALKMQNITRPKDPNKDDKDFTKLVDKYKKQLTNSSNRKKWFEESG